MHNEAGPEQLPASSRWWIPVLVTLAWTIVAAAILWFLSRDGGKKFDTTWIVVSVMPVLLWLLLTGRIAGLKAFGIEFKAAIRQASRRAIKPDPIEFEHIDSDIKGSREKIPTFVRQKITALTFIVGKKSYYETSVMRDYLDDLRRHSFFRWITFVAEDGRFIGLFPAESFQQFATHNWFDWMRDRTESGYDLIKARIESGDLSDFPGLIGSALALSVSDSKGKALEKFTKTDANFLPVLSEDGKLVGVVNRGKLNSEVIQSVIEAAQGS